MKKVAFVVMVMLLLSSFYASAYELKPRRGSRRSYSVTEPAAIALLGAGLVSLGIYAKKKRGKKQ